MLTLKLKKINFFFLISLVLFCSLSVWQFKRGLYKKELEKVPTKDYSFSDFLNLNDFLLKTVSFECKFLKESFLLDNRTFKGKPGYLVITPCKLENTKKLLLIERGWKDKNFESINNFKETVHKGISYIPGNPVIIEKYKYFYEKNNSNYILQYFNFDLIEKLLSSKVHPFVIKHSFGDYQYMKIEPPITSQKHFGYSFQWISLAILTIIYFVIFNRRKSS